jgi:hypothetical protein
MGEEDGGGKWVVCGYVAIADYCRVLLEEVMEIG